MKDTKLEGEADTLPAARAILERQVPSGLFLADEEILVGGAASLRDGCHS